MMSESIRLRISSKTKTQVDMLKDEYKLKTYGDVVEFLMNQYFLQEQIRLSEKTISKLVSEILLENLKPMIENINRKTGYIDKNVQINTDMLNHLIVGENLDALYAHSIKNNPTKVYKMMVEQMNEDIKNKQVKKNYREGNEV
ncbi:hypothetical protein SAMN05421767_10418 [Granulicatella balaenopterae]|uniref:Uncharacterized protein n=2 Tax=Granulicatella balaenopterae TaxID=137733 RepID=A0A1H9I0U1_9LACT|nr:hypothetical protein SAMN05421767_10418 [Granulicatella balaenopterae]